MDNAHAREGHRSDGSREFSEQYARTREGSAKTSGQWGGARNFRDRVTEALNQHQAESILHAMAIADFAGMPFNRHWTVNYEWAGIPDSEGAAFIGRLLSQCRRYARRRGRDFAAVWVREIGVKNGAHVHIAFHWPTGWQLRQLPRKWIKAAGGKYARRVSKVQRIGGRANCAEASRALYRENLEAVANYMLKGSADDVAEELGLSLRKRGGEVIGKRSGRTQNVAKTSG